MKTNFDAFIIYDTDSGKDLAEHLKKALRRLRINAFVATKDIPLGVDEQKYRFSILKTVNNIFLIVTEGIIFSTEVKKEIKECVKNGKKENIKPFIYEAVLKTKARKFLKKVKIGIKQWQDFNTKEDLVRKVQSWYSNNYQEKSQKQTGIPIYSDGLPSADLSVFIPFLIGLKLMANYKWDEAIKNFRKVLKVAEKESYKVALLNLISSCLYKQDKLKQAFSHLEKSLVLARKISDKRGITENLNNIGIIYVEQGYFKKAIINYTKAIEIDRNFAPAYNNRGNAYYKKEEFDKAIADYTKAIEINPKYAQAYCNRGLAYHKKEEFDKAIADYIKAIELNPKHAQAMANLGLVYRLKRINDKAKYYYKQALKNKDNLEQQQIVTIQNLLKELEGK